MAPDFRLIPVTPTPDPGWSGFLPRIKACRPKQREVYLPEHFFDDQSIEIPCPRCHQTAPKTVDWIRANDRCVCAGCNAEIIVDQDSLLAQRPRLLCADRERKIRAMPIHIHPPKKHGIHQQVRDRRKACGQLSSCCGITAIEIPAPSKKSGAYSLLDAGKRLFSLAGA
jgi:hypothetical protein